MALEIERRFLVRGHDWRSRVSWQARLRQGYLRSDADGFTLRVRMVCFETHSSARATRDCGGQDGRLRPESAARPAAAELASPASQAFLTIKAPLPPESGPGCFAPDHAPGSECPAPVQPGSFRSRQALTRLEFEYAIPVDDGEQLLDLAGCRLEKLRYGLDLSDDHWVVDVFEAENAPLVVAEVELSRADAASDVPGWCGVELTGWHQLSNAALAQRPLSRWPDAERTALLAGEPLWPGSVQG
ncbi:MAG: CYTH domain-containing protein [Cyanobium sp.]|jgi:adenylate cyclase|nr:CYTH domain-containing protein [Synechococcaceae cyanobacterium]